MQTSFFEIYTFKMPHVQENHTIHDNKICYFYKQAGKILKYKPSNNKLIIT